MSTLSCSNIVGSPVVNAGSINVGSNVNLTTTSITVGNSTVNVVSNSSVIFVGNSTVNTSYSASSVVIQGNTTSNVAISNGNVQINGSAVSPFDGARNRLINGNFNIAQRSTGSTVTPTAGTTTYQSVDRWFVTQTGTTASMFVGQTTPQTTGVKNAGYFGRTSGQTNVPNYLFFGQQIESINMYDLRGKTVTLSFNCFRGANAPSTLTMNIRSGTGTDQSSTNGLGGTWTGYSVVNQTSFSIGTTVASYSVTVTIPTDASELMVLFFYAPTGTAGANEWFAFENVQLEIGSVATPFETRQYTTELALCQRYYFQAGGTAAYEVFASGAIGSVNGTYYGGGMVNFPVTMRAAPTITIAGTWASTYVAFATFAAVNPSPYMAWITHTGSYSGVHSAYATTLYASNDLTARLKCSSEL